MRQTTSRIVGWAAPLAPLMAIALVYVAWAVAFWQLGRRPIPHFDDPMYLGGLSTKVTVILSNATIIVLMSWVVSMVALLALAAWPSSLRSWLLKRFAIGLAAIGLLILSMDVSPGNAVTWFLD